MNPTEVLTESTVPSLNFLSANESNHSTSSSTIPKNHSHASSLSTYPPMSLNSSSAAMNPTVPRVSQLEAISLDHELSQLLYEQMAKAFHLFKVDPYRYRVEFQSIFLALLLWHAHGAKLQAFHYFTPSSSSSSSSFRFRHRTLQIFIYIALPYLLKKWNFVKFEALFTLMELIHTLIFYVTGKYPNLVDRLLRIQVQPLSPSPTFVLHRQVSHTFLYRELIWSSLTETVSLMVPFLPKWITWLNSWTTSSSASLLSPSVCGICGSVPSVPVHALPCHCLYCYYCSYSKTKCLRCKKHVTGYQRC